MKIVDTGEALSVIAGDRVDTIAADIMAFLREEWQCASIGEVRNALAKTRDDLLLEAVEYQRSKV